MTRGSPIYGDPVWFNGMFLETMHGWYILLDGDWGCTVITVNSNLFLLFHGSCWLCLNFWGKALLRPCECIDMVTLSPTVLCKFRVFWCCSARPWFEGSEIFRKHVCAKIESTWPIEGATPGSLKLTVLLDITSEYICYSMSWRPHCKR